MLYSESDFSKYLSDFYMKDLSGEQKQQRRESLNRLRDFATAGMDKCRRRMICEFFNEAPQFESCGTCDLSKAAAKLGVSATRDFTQEAALICRAVGLGQNGVTKTQLWPIVRGTYKGAGSSGFVHGIAQGMPGVAAAYK